MNYRIPVVLALAAAFLTACETTTQNSSNEVISTRYIHPYGYDLSAQEWDREQQSGQVISTRRDGTTIVASYEGGIAHGLTTETYPHSKTVRVKKVFDRGILNTITYYDVRGIPEKEESFPSPTIMKVRAWFSSGTPKYEESYVASTLNKGLYFNAKNELESEIEEGSGVKVIRSQEGQLLAKEYFESAMLDRLETFHANGTPKEFVSYLEGEIHGKRSLYNEQGEPISVEEWDHGQLHGIATYYQNGYKFLEIPYTHGKKHGIERQFIDGDVLSEETKYLHDLKHGPSVLYCNNLSKTQWYFLGDKVSKRRFDELIQREKEIAALHGKKSELID